jgi:hypothetical protein
MKAVPYAAKPTFFRNVSSAVIWAAMTLAAIAASSAVLVPVGCRYLAARQLQRAVAGVR